MNSFKCGCAVATEKDKMGMLSGKTKVALSGLFAVGLLSMAADAADVPSTAYVPSSLVAHWDGIDNTLANGVRSHDGAATVWCDLTGNANDLTLPTFVEVESNAMVSRVSPDGPSKTGLAAQLDVLKGMKDPGMNGNAYTVEIVMQRVEWRYFEPSGVSASDVHTATVVYHPAASQLYVDATQYAINYNDSYTSAWSTNFTFFSNPRADIRIHAIRVYDRALAANEIAHNAMIDRVRFLGAEIPLEIRSVPSAVFDGTHPCEPEPVVVNALTGEALAKGASGQMLRLK